MNAINFTISILSSLLLFKVSAWQPVPFRQQQSIIRQSSSSIIQRTSSSHLYDSVNTGDEIDGATEEKEDTEKLCYYKVGDKWKQRIKLEDLSIGQKITGEKIRNADLLGAKTGPKIFFECGIGRIDKKGNWQMVSGMYRVAKNYAKPKVVKKKVQRLTGKEVELYVSKIRSSQGKLEVCASLEEFEREMEKVESNGEIVSASTLKVGEEVVGKVVDVRPYGVMVDVGANRKGLLHIQTVADLYGRFINKDAGLIEAGLERGAKVKLCVKSNEKKRLFLDFTQETKDLAVVEAEAETADKSQETDISVKEVDDINTQGGIDKNEKQDCQGVDPYEDQAGAWASYYDDDNDYNEGEDEDRDIEDALGIGFY